jgi:vacuolar-type H+-ATPase subunit H
LLLPPVVCSSQEEDNMATVNALAVQSSSVVVGSAPVLTVSRHSSTSARLSSTASCSLGGLRLNVNHAASTSFVSRSHTVRSPLVVRAEESVTDSIKGAAQSAADQLKDAASGAKDKVQGAAQEVGNFVSGKSEEAKDAADSASREAQRNAEKAGSQVENASRNLERDARGTASNVRGDADNLAVSTNLQYSSSNALPKHEFMRNNAVILLSQSWDAHARFHLDSPCNPCFLSLFSFDREMRGAPSTKQEMN